MNYHNKKFRPVQNTKNGEPRQKPFFTTSRREISSPQNTLVGKLSKAI